MPAATCQIADCGGPTGCPGLPAVSLVRTAQAPSALQPLLHTDVFAPAQAKTARSKGTLIMGTGLTIMWFVANSLVLCFAHGPIQLEKSE